MGLVKGHWTVYVIEPDGSQTEYFRSPQKGHPGRPFAFSRALEVLEADTARQL